MSIKKSFGIDKATSEDGRWFTVDFDENNKPVRFKLAYMSSSNKKMSKLTAELTKPYKRQIDNGTLPEKISEDIALKVFVRSVLLDWDNVIVEEGAAPLPFEEDVAIELMTEFRTLFEHLLMLARDFGNFKQADNEDIAKN